MKPADAPPAGGPNKKSLFGFLIGVAAGVVVGWLGILFGRKRQPRQTGVVLAEDAYYESAVVDPPSESLMLTTPRRSHSDPALEPGRVLVSSDSVPIDPIEREEAVDIVVPARQQFSADDDLAEEPAPGEAAAISNPLAAEEGSETLISPDQAGVQRDIETPIKADLISGDSPQNSQTPETEAEVTVSEFSNIDPTHTQGVEVPATRPIVPRPRLVEPSDEYSSSGGHFLPEAYLKWNRWIFEKGFAGARRNEEVFLSITPKILGGIAADNGGLGLLNEAVADFEDAVRGAYDVIIRMNGRLRILRAFEEGTPLCLAFLAASVLAAYRMQSDEEISGRAYYLRLADLLGCEIVGGRPRGFDPTVFESLWFFVQRWLADVTGGRLAMPGSEGEARRFVALPLTHVPLRRLDIEKLPSFFVWAGYAPAGMVVEAKLLSDLERWVRSYDLLSSAGAAAVMDERRRAVLVQVAHELGAWDGSGTEPGGRRSVSVELMLDIVRYRPDLFYLPRRPDGFPGRFDDGVHVFEAGDDGWYAPLQLSSSDGPELANGFEWIAAGNVSMRRAAAEVIPLGPSPDYTGYLSRSNLLRGARCAVLCRDEIVQATAEYLAASTGQNTAPIRHPNIPAGWKLFANIRPNRRIEVPGSLAALDLASEVDVICTGGLRLGRRRAWMAGAEPRIIVSGLENGDITQIDGQVVHVGEDGVLQINAPLGKGVHIIDAAGLRRTIEIVEPTAGTNASSDSGDSKARYVALPPGQWYLVGAMPGQATARVESRRPGKICRADFDPVWAVSVDSGPGAFVINLQRAPPQPAIGVRDLRSSSTSGFHHWASIVYSAGVRRPRFGSLLPNADILTISIVWKQYVSLARELKRQWRRSR